MMNVGAPENTINTKDLGNPRTNKLSSDLWEREDIIWSILILTTDPLCSNCPFDLRRQSRIIGPMSVLCTAGSNKAQLPQVDEASDNLDEPRWVVNEITERKAKALDQFALAGDDLRDHLDKLACAGGLEEYSVVVKIEPGLRTGLHGAEGTREVVDCTDVAGLPVDLDEWRRWHQWLKSTAIVVAHVFIIPSPGESDSSLIVLHGHLPDLDAQLGRQSRETVESCTC